MGRQRDPIVKISAMKEQLYKTNMYGGIGIFPNIYFSPDPGYFLFFISQRV